MKKFYLLLPLATLLFGENITENKTCKSCHPKIYAEFAQSMHYKSSASKDDVYKKLLSQKIEYDGKNSCKKCHEPVDSKNADEEAISCAYCHTIKDVEKSHMSNKNINGDLKTFFASSDTSADNEAKTDKKEYKEETSFFGLFKKKTGSPYHTIDYSNKNFSNGESCMGCHSHKRNEKDFLACQTGSSNQNGKSCIECHMPKVNGSTSTIKNTQTHSSHEFFGAYANPAMLEKHIDLALFKDENSITIELDNKSPHDLLLHPLRTLFVKIITSDGKILQKEFARRIGDENGAAPSWSATKILRDDMPKTGKTKIVFEHKPNPSQSYEVIVGLYEIDPAIAQKMGLSDSHKESKIIKKVRF